MKITKEKVWATVKKYAKRYFIDATGSMALGLFATLIIGLILSQIARIPGLDFLNTILSGGTSNSLLASTSPLIGAGIGAAIAYGLKHKPLVIFSSIVTGAIGYMYGGGGPLGAYVAALVGAEIGGLIAGRTKVDIILVPSVTILSGGLIALLVGPGVAALMSGLNALIGSATRIAPFTMGVVVSVAMGMLLTAPISSAAIAIAIGLGAAGAGEGSALAAGAATVGCCANMIGFAVASFRENKWGGLIAQGVGTPMLQVPNIVRRPQIWAPAILTSAILGPLSTLVFKMTNIPSGAGMGTSGLVGQFGTYESMVVQGGGDPLTVILYMLLLHIVLPAGLTLLFSEIMRKLGWIKYGDMKLDL
ncbi:MAG: PTS sugar transporter subunit IIC [Eubacteriales bacterium]|nr:PTS sugar transporter subunit IIC [Eubacteriales bacterium]